MSRLFIGSIIIMRKLTESEQRLWDAVCKTVINSPRVRFKTLVSNNVERVAPSKYLDLHGMTQDQSYHNISCFIQQNFDAGQREIAIITGKGSNGVGSLKRLVPYWLSSTLKDKVHSYKVDPKNTGQVLVTLRKKAG